MRFDARRIDLAAYRFTTGSPGSVTLSGGSRISGANQFGVAISGVRTEPRENQRVRPSQLESATLCNNP
jgi:hypothetical protein